MTTYRTDDGTRWGAGKGSNLTPAEVDINFWDVISRLSALEDHSGEGVGIDYITVSGNQLTIHMTDHSIQGPFTLPTAQWNFRGAWAASTVYAIGDVVTYNGSVYLVIFNHTSATTFDPAANDGAGHDYYALLLTYPADVLPLGGSTGQVLAKASSTDLDVEWETISTVPPHGTTGQVLAKNSSTDFDTGWQDFDLSALFDVLISGTPSHGESLCYDGSATKWVNQTLTPAQVRQSTITALTTSGTASLDPTLGDVFTVTPAGTLTINAASAPAGARITIVITTSGTSRYTITFGTNFTSTGTLATGTASGKVFTITFISDGSFFRECSRTTAM